MAWRPDYLNADELKGFLRIDDAADDVFIARWISAASRSIDNATGRQFGQVGAAIDRFYTPVYDRDERAYFAEIDDIQDVTGLTVQDENGNDLTYKLLPRNAPADGEPYTRMRVAVGDEITVHALFGWSAVPDVVPAALLMQANRLAARRDSPFGIAGSPSEGSELRLLARLDPDVELTLRPVVRKWWAA